MHTSTPDHTPERHFNARRQLVSLHARPLHNRSLLGGNTLPVATRLDDTTRHFASPENSTLLGGGFVVLSRRFIRDAEQRTNHFALRTREAHSQLPRLLHHDDQAHREIEAEFLHGLQRIVKRLDLLRIDGAALGCVEHLFVLAIQVVRCTNLRRVVTKR